jgi:hypothetical protein
MKNTNNNYKELFKDYKNISLIKNEDQTYTLNFNCKISQEQAKIINTLLITNELNELNVRRNELIKLLDKDKPMEVIEKDEEADDSIEVKKSN